MNNFGNKKSNFHQLNKITQEQQTSLLNLQKQQKKQKQNAILKIKQSLNNNKRQKRSYQNIFLPSQQSSPTLLSNNFSLIPTINSTLPIQSTRNKIKTGKQKTLIKNNINNTLKSQNSFNQKQLFKHFSKEQQFIEPSPQVNSNYKNFTSLKTIPNLPNFQMQQLNTNKSPPYFKSPSITNKVRKNQNSSKIIPQQNTKNNKQLHVETENNLQFGKGLQQIDKTYRKMNGQQQQNRFVNTYSTIQKNNKQQQNLFRTFPSSTQQNQKQNSNFKPTSTGFTNYQSSMSLNKKRINRRINQVQKRQSSKNFYKRPFSASYSHQFINSQKQNNKRQSKKQSQKNSNISIKMGGQKYISDNKDAQRRISINDNISPKLRNLKQNEIKPYKSNNPYTIHNHNQIKQPHLDLLHLGLTQIVDVCDFISRRKAQINLSIANNLTRLLFRYNGGHATTLYNYGLKLKNQSPVSIFLKVKCTSPSHYCIRPSTTIQLQPSQIVNFSIQLKLYAHDLNPLTMKHELIRYKKDKFKICYQASEIHPDLQYQEGQKVLPVVIQQTEQQKIRNEGMIKNMKNQEQKLAIQQKQVKIYKNFIQKNNQIMKQLQQKIKYLNQKQFYLGYFTKGLFITTIAIGAGLGFWFG